MKFSIVFIFLLSSVFAKADDLTDIDKLGNTVIQLLEKAEITNIVSKTMSTSSISKYISQDDFDQSDGTFEKNIKLMGKYYSSEVLHEGGIKSTFWSRWYIIRFERQPLMIYMEFYKPNDTWEVHSMRMDTDLSQYIHDAGQVKIGLKGLELEK